MSTKVIEEEDSDDTELVFAKCDCCGLTEECTQAYIDNIRQTYQGKYCFRGLCEEAVNDEIARTQGLITPEEAMARHIDFCWTSRNNPAVHLVDAMKHILRRSPRSAPSRSIRISRSESCMLTLALQSSSSSYTD